MDEYVEDNQILPDSQNGFRKGRGTIDCIYILNHCVLSAIEKGKHVYAAFIDLKAAFDFVDRKKLFKMMRDLQIPEYLTRAIEEIYKYTPYTIGDTTFATDMGLKQGCPLSPILFAIYISDLDKTLKNWQHGGVIVGRTKIFTLVYADDMVLLADRPSEMKEMLGALFRYTKRKGLTINAEKCKVMKFSAGGVGSNQVWRCGPHLLEEVKSFVYLGFTFQATGKHHSHVEKLASQGKRCSSTVWSIGQREFKDNYTIRSQMFESLVRPSFTYGCELFGYEGHESLEVTQRRYYKWTLGVAPWTKTTLLLQETRTEPLHIYTGYRALAYEERAVNSPCLTLRECIKEVLLCRKNRHTTARNNHFIMSGFSPGVIAQGVERGDKVASTVRKQRSDQFLQLQWCALSRMEDYVWVENRLPAYLKRGIDIQVVARFRLQNEERGKQSWRKDQTCRTCKAATETVDHMLRCCAIGGGWTEKAVMNEGGRGLMVMRKLLERRKTEEQRN